MARLSLNASSFLSGFVRSSFLSRNIITPSHILASREMSNSNVVDKLDYVIESENLIGGVLNVASHIKPQWQKAQLKHKIFKDGITNKLVGVYCENNGSDMVLVRVYGKNTDWMIDRAVEINNIQILQSVGLAAPLYASFVNGLAYKYLPGKTLNPQNCRDEKLYPHVAKLMAVYHQHLNYFLQNSIPNENDGQLQTVLWEKTQRFLNLVPEKLDDEVKQKRYEKNVPSKAELIKEFEWMKKQVESLNSPIVFCHNDLLLGNIVYDEPSDKMNFIDFEYAGPNYQAYDIANHFCEFAGVDDIDHSRYPDKDFQRKWISVYLKTFHKKEHIADEEVELLLSQVEKFSMTSHFFWSVWSLIQAAHSTIAFDFLGYSISRLNEYFRWKKYLFS